MDAYAQLNELVTIIQKWRDIQNFQNGTDFPAIQPRDIYEMVNEQPQMLQEVLNLARDNPLQLGYTESLPDEFTTKYVENLRGDWRFLPSDYNLFDGDYTAIVNYLQGRDSLSQLNVKQRGILDSILYEADDFSVGQRGFKFDHDVANSYNLREQLLGRLERDNIMTPEMVSQLEMDGFPENFNYFKVSGGQVPGVAPAGRVQIPGQIEDVGVRSDEWFKQRAKDIIVQAPQADEEFVNDWGREHHNLDVDELGDLWDAVEMEQIQNQFNQWRPALEYFDDIGPRPNVEMQALGDSIEKPESVYAGDSDIEDPMQLEEKEEFGDAGEPVGTREQLEMTQMETALGEGNKALAAGTTLTPEESAIIKSFGDTPQTLFDSITESAGPEWTNVIGMNPAGEVVSTMDKLAEYGLKQIKGMASAPMLVVMNQLLNNMFGGDTTASSIVNFTLAGVDFLNTLDPAGLVGLGLLELNKELEFQHQRAVRADDPTSVASTKFGYIRDQNDGGKWKPAIYQSDDPSQIFGGRGNTVTMSYSADGSLPITFKDSVYFPNQQYKTFDIDDRDLDGEMFYPDSFGREHMAHDKHDEWTPYITQESYRRDSYEYVSKNDILRDWFWVAPEDVETWLAGDLPEFPLEGFYDEEGTGANRTTYSKQIEDWSQALQLAQNEHFSRYPAEVGEESKRFLTEIGLRRQWLDQSLATYNETWALWDPDIITPELIARQGYDSWYQPENQYLTETILKNSIDDLIKSQKRAALESGLYPTDEAGIAGEERFYDYEWQRPWSQKYLDPYDIPSATSAEELQKQYEEINALENRTTSQKEYLSNRSTVRYWLTQADTRNGLPEFEKDHYGERASWKDEGSRNDLSYWDKMLMFTDQPSVYDDEGKEIPPPKLQPPWSLVHEEGYLPDNIDTEMSWWIKPTIQDESWFTVFPDEAPPTEFEADQDLLDDWIKEQKEREKAEAEKQPDADFDPEHTLEPLKTYRRGDVEFPNPDWIEWRKRWPDLKSRYDEPDTPEEETIEPPFYRTEPKDPKYDPKEFYPDLSKGGRKMELFEEWKFHNDVESPDAPLYGLPDAELWEMYINRTGPVADDTDHLVNVLSPRTQYIYDHMYDAPDPDVQTKPTAEIIESPPEPQGLPAPVVDKPKEVPHLSQFGNFLLHEHLDEFQNLVEGKVTEEDLRQQYPVGSAGQFVIGGDDELEEQLGLPDEIRAVKIGDEILEQYDPYQVSLPQLGGSIYNSFHTILS